MKKAPGGGHRRPGVLSSRAMRRSIALIALLALLTAGIPTGGRSASAMACCHGGAVMACCLPASGCAMKSCPPAQAAETLPGLPPAALDDAAAATAPELAADRIAPVERIPLFFAPAPPEQPPRG
jgi:hypothetical protein